MAKVKGIKTDFAPTVETQPARERKVGHTDRKQLVLDEGNTVAVICIEVAPENLAAVKAKIVELLALTEQDARMVWQARAEDGKMPPPDSTFHPHITVAATVRKDYPVRDDEV